MRIPSGLDSLLLSSALLTSVVQAVSLDCAHIVTDKIKYDLKGLAGVHTIFHTDKHEDYTVNTTYVMNICSNLGKASIRDGLNCGTTRNICGFEYNITDGLASSSNVFPIAGFEHVGEGAIDPKITRLKKEDPDKEGLRIKLGGGGYTGWDHKKKDAQAVIEFQCDPNRSGLEGLVEGQDNEERAVHVRVEGGEEDKNDGTSDSPPPDNGSNPDQSLQFNSFGLGDDDTYVLSLTWRTRYACDNYVADRDADLSSHWGFFTWLIIIFFLCAAAYLIFGSWLNYNRYGARGWDLLPHGDTIRDIPYIFQDWLRRVVNTLQGAGSRGGYSAV